MSGPSESAWYERGQRVVTRDRMATRSASAQSTGPAATVARPRPYGSERWLRLGYCGAMTFFR